jgi:predicted nucleic acid-binding protein
VPANVFLDTSALLKRFVEERGSDTVRELLTEPTFRGYLFIARHLEPELISALNQRYRDAALAHRQVETALAEFRRVEDIFGLVPLNESVIQDAARILNSHRNAAIRAGDAFHLAALRYLRGTFLRGERLCMMSSDRSMLALAGRLGIESHDPERESVSVLRS